MSYKKIKWDFDEIDEEESDPLFESENILKICDSLSLENPPTPEGPILSESFKLLANSSQMGGPLRFAMGNVVTTEECEQLLDLELKNGHSQRSPCTKFEQFGGIGLLRAAELAEKGKLPLSTAKLFFDVSERVRQQVAAYFKLDQLYFHLTYIVCRTALNGSAEFRKDRSHPIHADNCMLQDNGDCLKIHPAPTSRDFSSILYLNDDFEGGQLVITDKTQQKVMVQIQPKCGRMVGFISDSSCLHGVKAVIRGRRCAMPVWFTLDPLHEEKSRKDAKQILDRLERNELRHL